MPAKFSIFPVAAMSLIPFAFACGGDDDGGGPIMVQPDASSGPMDAPPVNCTADPSYSPTFGADTQGATIVTGMQGTRLNWSGLLNTQQPLDGLVINLFSGFTVFENGIVPGTFQLTGEETSFATCGACVEIGTDLVMTQQGIAPTDVYFATGGTLTLTSVEQTFEATVTDLTLTHVTIAQDLTTTPVGDGCNTTIASATMSTPIQMGGTPPMPAMGDESARVMVEGTIPVRVMIKDRKER